jgi:hypothetical protein
MELKCQVCGGLCIQDRQEGWKHEDPPDEPHKPVVWSPVG